MILNALNLCLGLQPAVSWNQMFSYYYSSSSNSENFRQKFSFHETQDFLLRNKFLNLKWNQITLPSIHSPQFYPELLKLLKMFTPGRAYACYVVASATNIYCTLGPSFILTSASNPIQLIGHLSDHMKYYEETYNNLFNGPCIFKFKDIGPAPEIETSIFHESAGVKEVKNPKGEAKLVVNNPIPIFDFSTLIFIPSTLDLRIQFPDLEGWLMSSYSKTLIVLTNRKNNKITINYYPKTGEIHYHSPKGNFYATDVHVKLHTIRRDINNSSIFFLNTNNSVINIQTGVNHKRLFSSGKIAKKEPKSNRVITADIEARIVNGVNIPYMCEWYGKDNDNNPIGNVFCSKDYNNDPFLMLQAFWTSLINLGSNHVVYFHNWGGYDAFLSLNPLICLTNNKNLSFAPIMKNGKILSLKVYRTENNRKSTVFEVKDSINVLPLPLGNLAKSFNVKTLKGHFPHYFVPEDINYVGPVPAYEYFEPKRTSRSEWKEIVDTHGNNWSYLEQSRRYLHSDVESLYEILTLFFSELYSDFKVNGQTNLSIPGISFKTWKVHQYPKVLSRGHEIYDLSKNNDTFFREGYLGGVVDVYGPKVENGYYYDINGLYPTAMLNPMPVGEPRFQTHITIEEVTSGSFYGFVHATVRAPKDLNIGVLSVRRSGKLITPTGTFNGTWFSEELVNALQYGYEIVSVAYGYMFERDDNVFRDLITQLMDMKTAYTVSGNKAKREIVKLLGNSLYGRFGMNPINTITGIYSSEESSRIHSGYAVTRCISFTNGMELLEYNPHPNVESIDSGLLSSESLNEYTKEVTRYSETNLPLAAAITAQSRIHINNIKMSLLSMGINVLYTDTDSLITDAPIPESYISSTKLGYLKLEHIIRTGYFIAPKLYWLECVQTPDELSNPSASTYIVSKSRGYGSPLTREQVEGLYNQVTCVVTKQKWFKSWSDFSVTIRNVPLNLTSVFTKRNRVFEYNSVETGEVQQWAYEGNDHKPYISVDIPSSKIRWVGTRPIVLNDTPVGSSTPQPTPNLWSETDQTNQRYFTTVQNLLLLRQTRRTLSRSRSMSRKKSPQL